MVQIRVSPKNFFVFKKIGLSRDLNPGPLAPKARIIPLDHWAWCCMARHDHTKSIHYNKLSHVLRQNKIYKNLYYGSGGIRTHASEETGALNQRLRPLGHATHTLRPQRISQCNNTCKLFFLQVICNNFYTCQIVKFTQKIAKYIPLFLTTFPVFR